MKDWLMKDIPRWGLIALILMLLPMAGYWFSDHISTDKQQSADIRELADTVHDMAKIVEYNYKETDNNTTNIHELRATQKRLEILLARIEVQLDRVDR